MQITKIMVKNKKGVELFHAFFYQPFMVPGKR